MRSILYFSALGLALSAGQASAQPATGLKTLESAHSPQATITKLETIIQARGMKIFTRIDHAAAAKDAGLAMPASTVVVFGNPKGGTPNFLKSPTLAIDLPLKALVWQDQAGKTFVSWNSGEYVFGSIFPRHGLTPPAPAVQEQENLLAGIMAEAVR